jgi:hypothetical protein
MVCASAANHTANAWGLEYAAGAGRCFRVENGGLGQLGQLLPARSSRRGIEVKHTDAGADAPIRIVWDAGLHTGGPCGACRRGDGAPRGEVPGLRNERARVRRQGRGNKLGRGCVSSAFWPYSAGPGASCPDMGPSQHCVLFLNVQ